MKSIAELTQDMVAFRDERDWKQFHNPKDVALSIMLEAAEVVEHFQWKNTEQMQRHIASHREDIAGEMADVLSYLLLLSHELEVDLVDAYEKKMAHNAAKYPVDKARGNAKKYTELAEG